jgi:hypothetical protein
MYRTVICAAHTQMVRMLMASLLLKGLLGG